MNPVNFLNRKFAPIVEAAKAEIENLRLFIQNNERHIGELRAQNVVLQQNLADNQRELAERVAQVNEARRLMGIEEPNPQERLEEVARRLVAELARGHQRIEQLEHQAIDAKRKQENLVKKLKIVGWVTTGVVSGAAVGYGTYKIVKVFAGIQLGAAAGATIGAAVGTPGGPLMLGTGAVGGFLGGLSGGIASLLTP